MIRFAPFATALVLAMTAPVSAGESLPPQFGMNAGGTCRLLAVPDRNSNAPVPFGCVHSGGGGFRLSPSEIAMTALPPMSLDFAARRPGGHNPPNAIMLGIGNRLAFCPALSCQESATTDHQRASLLIASETQVDGQAEEQTVGVLTTIKTGRTKKWSLNTPFVAGDNIEFPAPRNTVYRQTAGSCRSAATGTGPAGNGRDIVDGSCRWTWINASAINGKIGLYNEVLATTGGGKGWAQANNFEMRPGYVPHFVSALELDLTNHSGIDCEIGVANCNNLYLRTFGNKNTSSINVEGPDSGAAAAYFGLYMHGSRLASDSTIELATSGLAGIRIGGFLPAGYAQAAIIDQSTSPTGILLHGSYGSAQIKGAGWQVNPAGGIQASNVEIVDGALFERKPFVPPSSRSPCSVGQRSWDRNWEYRCVAANTWRRTPLQDW